VLGCWMRGEAFRPLRKVGTLAILSVLGSVLGCDSGGSHVSRGVAGTARLLDGQTDFKYVGKGRSKHKEPLSREERLKRLRQLGREQKATTDSALD